MSLTRFVYWTKGNTTASPANFVVASHLLFACDRPLSLCPCSQRHCCVSSGGFFLVRFSFSVRSRSSFSRVSVPFRRVVGLALSRGCCSWLLRSSSRSFSGSVVWCGFASRSREKCFCLRCLSFGRLCGVGSSWLVFCLWLRLVRLRACRALAVFVGGSSPFLGQHYMRLKPLFASYADIPIRGQVRSGIRDRRGV